MGIEGEIATASNITAIKAKTDLIGASVALESGGNLASVKTKTDLIPADNATQLDTNIPAIKAKTDLILAGTKLVTKTSTSVLTNGTLFNWAGAVQILAIIGTVKGTAIQNSAQTTKLSMVADALAAVDLCTALTITNFAIGSLLTITGAFADAMKGAGATAIGVAEGGQKDIVASCITSGTITVTFGTSGSLNGSIEWDILWIPLNAAGSITPA